MALERDLVEAINDAMDNHEWVKRRVTAEEFVTTLESHGYTITKVGGIAADAVIAEPSWVAEMMEDTSPIGGIEQFQLEDR